MIALARGSITDIAGLLVGHAVAQGRDTGCTVVLCPDGMVCGAAVRGGAPGTRETDLLRPENTVDRVHAVLLSGGSAFGLDAAGGVMRWLDERGHGLRVGANARVPIVPAAVLFDLWQGDTRIRPDASTGYAACQAASHLPPAQGRAGAGMGATVGKLFGIDRAMRGGIGSASVRVGGITVAALVAVNALGDVFGAAGQILAGARGADGQGFVASTASLLAGNGPPRWAAQLAGMGGSAELVGSATTIGVVATDAALSKAQATQLANMAHHGLARAVDPITANDGDAFFALASGTAANGAGGGTTGRGTGRTAGRTTSGATGTAAGTAASGAAGGRSAGIGVDISAIGAMAAEVVARAIRNAVLAAR